MTNRQFRSFDTAALRGADGYKLLTGLVVPRPIGWIGSVSDDGVRNLAPYSFFNAISGDPPTVMFSSGHRDPTRKDTTSNVSATGEFTVNIVNVDTVDAMNASSATVAVDVDEFELTGLTAVAGTIVGAPRVAEAVAQLECRVTHELHVGRAGGGNWMFIGEVVVFHVDEDVLDGTRIDQARLNGIGRHVGNWYSHATELFEIPRPA